MHNRIIQVWDAPINADDFIDEFSMDPYWSGCEIDYVYNTVPEQREEFIKGLVEQCLPAGMFSPGPEKDTIVYNGGVEKWVRDKWIPAIKKEVEVMASANFREALSNRQRSIIQLLTNALGIGTLFCIGDTTMCQVTPSTGLIEFVFRKKPGTVLHIGGIVGYS